MAFNVGPTPITKAYVGASAVQKLYVGTNLVWPVAVPPTFTTKIEYVGSTVSSSAASMAFPTHQAGDLLVVAAIGGAAPTPPGSGGYTDAHISPTGNPAARISYKWATAPNTSVGTWGGIASATCYVFRGVNTTTPFGTIETTLSSGVSVTATAPPITLTDPSGESLVVNTHYNNATTGSWNNTTPPGFVTKNLQARMANSQKYDTTTGEGSTMTHSQTSQERCISWELLAPQAAELTPIPVVKDVLGMAGSSMSLPAHQAGDLLVVFAQNTYTLAATAPTKPAADGTVPAWNTLYASPGSEGVPAHVGWFLATGTHTCGTWGNASTMSAVVFTNVNQADPIGAAAGVRHPSSVTATSPILTLEEPGTSAVMTYYATTTGTGGFGDPPEGYTKHYSGTKLCVNTKDDTTTYAPAGMQHDSGGALMWRAVAFEVLAPTAAADAPATRQAGAIKGNLDSGLYHMPDDPHYDETIAEQTFDTEADAQAAGFIKYVRKSKKKS